MGLQFAIHFRAKHTDPIGYRVKSSVFCLEIAEEAEKSTWHGSQSCP